MKEHDVAAILEAAVFETEDTLRPARLAMDRARLSGRIAAITGSADKALPAAGYARAFWPIRMYSRA